MTTITDDFVSYPVKQNSFCHILGTTDPSPLEAVASLVAFIEALEPKTLVEAGTITLNRVAVGYKRGTYSATMAWQAEWKRGV